MATLEDPRVLGGCVYYSQNREDLVLLSFFPNESKGFYVDVGAFDPDVDSVTKLFYLKGWNGINVEPQVDKHNLFQKRRKRDINLNTGIGAKDGKLTLRTYKSGGLSTFSDSIKDDYAARPDEDTGSYTDTEVPVTTLRKIFAANNVTHIDFLKVDVEGLEYDVLASNDWEKYRPEVLCIESNHIQADWKTLLKEANYKLVFNDGLNDYYVDARTDRAAKFDFVKEVVHDRGGGIRADHYELMLEWFNYGTDKAHHVEDLVEEKEKMARDFAAEWDDPKRVMKRLGYLLKQQATHKGEGRKRG